MDITQILMVVSVLVTWIFGLLAKKSKWFKNELIPMQNIAIGLIMAVIEWIITKNFSTAIALSGLIAGGTYDIFNNLRKIINGKTSG